MNASTIPFRDLTPARWWCSSTLSADPGDPATWYRSLVLEAPGDGAEILLEVTVNDEGGPTVDALTTAHTLRDLEALRRTLADLVPTLAALSTCRDEVRA